MSENSVRVEATKWGRAKHGRRHWKVIDDTGPKVFRRVLVYTYWEAAVINAHRLAMGGRISTHGLIGVNREPR